MTKSSHSALNDVLVTYREKFENGFSNATPSDATDLTRWRLLDERGRQTWHYLTTDEEVQAWPQLISDKHHLGLPLVSTQPSHLPLPPDQCLSDLCAKLT